MAFVNNGENYFPVAAQGHNLYTNDWSRQVGLNDGLYYREDQGHDERVIVARNHLHSDTPQASLLDYQVWVDGAWKTPHATYQSVERMGDKLYEEHHELLQEVRRVSDDPDDQTAKGELLSEAGDVLWCATALANNSGADIESGMRNQLFRYVVGVQHIGENAEAIQTPWRNKAAELATSITPITLGAINELLEEKFEPLFSTVMNIFDPDSPEADVNSHMVQGLVYCATLRNQVEEQFGWNEPDTMVLDSWFKTKARPIGETVANIFLETAYIAKVVGGFTVAEVIQKNFAKIESRTQAGLIDKTDGTRPPELQ